MTENELREFLVSRVRQLPGNRLAEVAAFLECGGLPPLFKTAGTAQDAPNISKRDDVGPIPLLVKDWPHSPIHRLDEHGTYIVTAGTFQKEHFFRGPERLDYLETNLLRIVKEFGWELEAWAVFSNHYHFVAHATPDAGSLRAALSELHSVTARGANCLDTTSGRRVWHNFWDTRLTYEKSYLARLNYVHQNSVKHGLVRVANQYPWCSAAWFERTATPAQVRTIYRFKIDQVRIADDYDPQ